jgi:ADP-heptose:LPS heptosyltransferase
MHTASSIDIICRPAHHLLTRFFNITDGGINIDSAVIAKLFTENCTEMITFVNSFSHAILFASETSQLVKNFKSHFKGELYYHNPLPDGNLHCTEYQLSIIDPVQSVFDPEFRIPYIPFETRERVKTNRICIHTGSGSRLKNWDLKKYIRLSEFLKCQGYTICWIRGYAEMSEMYPIEDTVYSVDSLIDLSMFLRDSLLFVGNDSGFSHLAAACGCKVVSIFGPSEPNVWAPKGYNDICVVYNKKRCSPCHLRDSLADKECQRECLEGISINAVADICLRLISNLLKNKLLFSV